MQTVDVVVGGQFGSESKGRTTAEVVKVREAQGHWVNAVRVAGPNAGHVVFDEQGNRFALRQVPVAAAVSDYANLVIAAGSEIDFPVLQAEIEQLEAAGHSVRSRLNVHPEAVMIGDEHKQQEGALVGAIGSTGKGIGAARAAHLMRTAQRVHDQTDRFEDSGIRISRMDLNQAKTVVIEGTQGFGLGLRSGFYPQVTSSDCRAIDFLAMAGVNPWGGNGEKRMAVHLVIRPNPIRVAGNSGPLKGETSWATLGLPEERTTVTQKIRRVGEWDGELVARAIAANGGAPTVRVSLAMLDHVFPEIAGCADPLDLPGEVLDWVHEVEKQLQARVTLVGTGPQTSCWIGAI